MGEFGFWGVLEFFGLNLGLGGVVWGGIFEWDLCGFVFFGVLGNFCLGLGFGVVYGLPRSPCGSLAMTADFVILSLL